MDPRLIDPPAGARSTADRAVLAVDIGGTSVKGALVEDGRILARTRRPTFEHRDGATGSVTRVVAALLDDASGQGLTVSGVGVASPGRVDSDAGTVANAVNLDWRDEAIGPALEAAFGLPVAIDHDARAAGRAEAAARGAAGVRDSFAFVPVGTGISAAMIIDGRPVLGHSGLAGEFGHIRARPGGDACACGAAGCIEAYASAASIRRRYRAAGGDPRFATSAIAGVRATDPIAAAVWADAVDALGFGVAALTAMLDPGVVVVGGGLSLAGEALLAPVRDAVAAMLPWRQPPRIEASRLGQDAGLYGAALLAASARARATEPG